MWQYHPILLVFQLGGFISIGVAAYCLHRLWTRGYSDLVLTVGVFAFNNAVYNVAATLKVASPELGTKLLMYKLEFLGAAVNPSVAIVLALIYLGYRRWLTHRVIAGLALVSTASVVLVIANPGDVMIVDPKLVSVGGISALEHEFPPLFVAYVTWASGTLLFAGILVGHAAAVGKVRRAPGVLIGFAFIVPVLANTVKMIGLYPPGGDGINVTPGLGALSLAMVALAIGRYRLFELLPVGREQAIDVMEDGYVLTDASGDIVDVNPAARSLLDPSKAEPLLDRPADEVIPVFQDLDGASDAVLFEAGPRTIQVRCSRIADGNQLAGRVLILRDVTTLRERERALKRKNERLDQFASVVSHDLRNPLNVAQGRLSLAKEEEDRDHLAAVDRALNRMDEIMEDVLSLTWGGQTPDPEELETCSFDEVVRTSWNGVETSEATLRVEDTAVVRADEARLRRLLENLFRNAVEHGGDDVTVRVGTLDDGFFVNDDGAGIPEDRREKVLEGGYSSKEEGTGLGLSIVQAIVEAHGWDISVVESPDGGAQFEFRGLDVDHSHEWTRNGASPEPTGVQ